MSNREHINKSLSALQKENPFRVPEGYFQNFPDRLNEHLKKGYQVPHRKKALLAIRYYAAAAILVIAVVLSGIAVFKNPKAETPDLTQEISMMIENNLYSFQEETIWEAIATSENTSFNDETMEYLINEDINENEIINAL
jgi:hypothetical protein